ncbi:MAG: hypothetical protein Q4E33_00530 [Erysipelotrichaceae bacterium]|nr:hypothetical protein [Erysipelotrichaceae bacterium]
MKTVSAKVYYLLAIGSFAFAVLFMFFTENKVYAIMWLAIGVANMCIGVNKSKDKNK